MKKILTEYVYGNGKKTYTLHCVEVDGYFTKRWSWNVDWDGSWSLNYHNYSRAFDEQEKPEMIKKFNEAVDNKLKDQNDKKVVNTTEYDVDSGRVIEAPLTPKKTLWQKIWNT
jgi:hypothetical protein